MAKSHALAWVLGGGAALLLLSGRLSGANAAGAAGGSPAASGGSPLSNLFSSLFGGGAGGGSAGYGAGSGLYQPPGGGFYTGLGNQNYMPVNYSPTATNYTAYGAASPGPTSYFSPQGGGVTPGMLV